MGADRARLWWGVGLVAAAIGGGVVLRVAWDRLVTGGSQPIVVFYDTMRETLLPGDIISYEPHAYRDAQPARGDVIVCRFRDSQLPTVYRVVGLPGEQVQVQGRQIYVDQRLLPEPYLGPETPVTAPSAASREEADKGETADEDDESGSTGPYSVPADGVFVRGDHRVLKAQDWGVARRSQILGRAFRILWSASSGRGRWDRVGKRIR